MGAGCREQHMQRQPVVVDEQVVLRAGFAPVSGVRAGQLAPLFARTDTASMLARDQSKTSAWASSSSTRCCSRSHTPAACQARSRRQAACPEPSPGWDGRSRQRHPVLSTNKMPRAPPGPRSAAVHPARALVAAVGAAARAAPATDHRPTAASWASPRSAIRSCPFSLAAERHAPSSETRSKCSPGAFPPVRFRLRCAAPLCLETAGR